MEGESMLQNPQYMHCPGSRTDQYLHSFSPAYDNDEPEYDPEEPAEPDVETAHIDDIDIGENPDQLLLTGDSSRGVVSSGEPTAAANRENGGEKGPKEKRICERNRERRPARRFPGFTSKNSPGTVMIFSASAARKNPMSSLKGGGKPATFPHA